MPKKLCNLIGCSNIIAYEARYCADHQRNNSKAEQAKDYNKNRRDKSASKFYNSSQWKKLRTIQLNDKPLCEICRAVGQVVDHKIEISDGGCATCLDNLQTLCKICHNVKTAKVARDKKKREGASNVWN